MVEEKRPIIVWPPDARKKLQKIHKDINKDSPKNAQKVIQEIIATMKGLISNPTRHPLDHFKQNNPGAYRAF